MAKVKSKKAILKDLTKELEILELKLEQCDKENELIFDDLKKQVDEIKINLDFTK